MNEKLIEITDLTVGYDGKKNALDNINMSVGHKEIVGIVGESGSGKSTLIRAIMNLLSSGGKITSGQILFTGEDTSKYNRRKWSQIRGNDICMIFQNPGASLDPIKKIGSQFIESIRSHMDITKNEAQKKAINTLQKMQLADTKRIMQSYPFQLSGGMKQRVCIAMALAMEPKLILADEPTSALDVISQIQIINELMALRNNFYTSIIIVTHNIGCAAYMADRIMVMKQGKVVEFRNKESVVTEPEMDYTKKLISSIPELAGC